VNGADDLRAERDRLQAALDASYAQLSEITTRMLAMNEAADSLVETHDVRGVAASLLGVCARAVGARSGGVFLSHGEGAFDLLAAVGFDDEAADALGQSLPDLALCQLAEDAKTVITAEVATAGEAFTEWRAEALAADPGAAVTPELELYVPLAVDESVVGVLALGAAPGGRPYAEDDHRFLEHVARQGALALDRALLFEQNQDRLRDLDALLRVSRELSSTLDLDHVLVTAVNLTGAIAPRERAVLALFDGGKLKVRAVSDFPRVDAGTAERLGIVRLLEYLGLRKADLVQAKHSEVEADEAHEGREVWREYFAGDMRGALALLLKDDQGPVGILLLEAYDERAFDRASDREALGVLVGQLSVAIRNAELYRQLPMVNALAPLAARRRAWQRMTGVQRTRLVAGAALALLLLAVVPWPAAVGGDGQVLPASEVPVRAAIAGLVRDVAVQSGDRVTAGQPLARLEPVALGARLAGLRAEADRALYAGAAAGDRRDAYARRLADLDREGALARLSAAEGDERRANLVAPVDGSVLTAGLSEMEGAWLEAGDVFAQVSTLDTLRVEVGVSEADIGRVRPGQPIRLKVLAFPDRQFHGRVTEVSWQGESFEAGRPSVFKVIGRVVNDGTRLRSGMTGRARVDVGRDTILVRAVRGLWTWLRLRFYA
jgi:multidrug efflux pump subunit AcrA (membrane-fusion protein)/transcriptional regulator with GAF, ATPase, and Fis domain